MLNHETDVIGNSQNVKKIFLSSVIVQNFFRLCDYHYSESFFSEAKNCLGDTCRN